MKRRLFALAILLALARPLHAQTYLGTVCLPTSNTGSGTSVSCNFTQPVAIGTVMIVVGGFNANTGGVSIADTKGNTYILRADTKGNTSNVRTTYWVGQVTTALTDTDSITVSNPIGGNKGVFADAFTGISTSPDCPSSSGVRICNFAGGGPTTTVSTGSWTASGTATFGDLTYAVYGIYEQASTVTFSRMDGTWSLGGSVRAETGSSNRAWFSQFKFPITDGSSNPTGTISTARVFAGAGISLPILAPNTPTPTSTPTNTPTPTPTQTNTPTATPRAGVCATAAPCVCHNPTPGTEACGADGTIFEPNACCAGIGGC